MILLCDECNKYGIEVKGDNEYPCEICAEKEHIVAHFKSPFYLLTIIKPERGSIRSPICFNVPIRVSVSCSFHP